MTLEFQDELLQFFTQVKSSKNYIEIVDESLFDIDTHQAIFSLIKEYTKKFKRVPSKGSLLQYWGKKSAKINGLTKEVNNEVEKVIRAAYVTFSGDSGLIEETLIESAQKKKFKKLVKDNAGEKLDSDPMIFKRLLKEMSEIANMQELIKTSSMKQGAFVLKDHETDRYSVPQAHRTFLTALNKMTAARGFYAPQLIVFVSGPKFFKTGTIMNIGAELMRNGLNGYHVDTENGAGTIRTRYKQQMGSFTLEELISGENDEMLSTLTHRYKALGGDIRVDFYPPYSKSVNDVRIDLQFLKDEYGWEPDFIIWDDPDKIEPEDKTRKDGHTKIQGVYNDIIKLNNELNVFSLLVSQVNRQAVEKAVFRASDLAGDFMKTANAHAVFAICATEDEQALGLRRILPIAQREGVPYAGKNVCVIRIDPERMQIQELGMEEAAEVVRLLEEKERQNAKSRFKKKPGEADEEVTKSIKDKIKDE